MLTLLIPLLVVTQAAAEPAVSLHYVGHASFQWQTPAGTTILIDPYENSLWSPWFLTRYPEMDADVLLITHDHFDHGAQERVSVRGQVIEMSGRWSSEDYEILGIDGRHAKIDTYGYPWNVIFCVTSSGVKMCHWGDNSAEIAVDTYEAITPVDILLLPIDDSAHLLTVDEIDSIIERIEPRVVIPMHYANAGLTSRCSTLGSVDRWLETRSEAIRYLPSRVEISDGAVPDTREIWVLSPSEAQVPAGEFALPCLLNASGPRWIVGVLGLGIASSFLALLGRRGKQRTTASTRG